MKRKWYLKATTEGRLPPYGVGSYPGCGRWTRKITGIEPCVKGWHAFAPRQAEHWTSLFANRLFVCQVDGNQISTSDKIVAERLRLLFEITNQDAARIVNKMALDEAKREGLFTRFGLASPRIAETLRSMYGGFYSEFEIASMHKVYSKRALVSLLERLDDPDMARTFERWVNAELKQRYPGEF